FITSLFSSSFFPYTTLFRSLFVFTTAYDTYAVDAFAIEALDYLLKPFDQVRLQKTLERIRIKLQSGQQEIMDTKDTQVASPASNKLLRSEEHTSELQSRFDLVCRLLH